MSVVHSLSKKGLLGAPQWLPDNVMYETYMGSTAYGVPALGSDIDLYGFCIPKKEMVFPHLAGEIAGFGTQVKRFKVFQKHDVRYGSTTYDLSIYNIVTYFQLCMENNPNMVDSMYTPINCVTHMTGVGQLVRDNRDLFLHKGYFHKAHGYAYSQLHSIKSVDSDLSVLIGRLGIPRGATIDDCETYLATGDWEWDEKPVLSSVKAYLEVLRDRVAINSLPHGKRQGVVLQYGYDVKAAYHTVRLVEQTRQVLETGTLDLRASKEILRSVRQGEWTLQQVKNYFEENEKRLLDLYNTSKLRHTPNEDAIKAILLDCLESHYGSLSKAVFVPDGATSTLEKIRDLTDRYFGGSV